jgi:hypothetical protein
LGDIHPLRFYPERIFFAESRRDGFAIRQAHGPSLGFARDGELVEPEQTKCVEGRLCERQTCFGAVRL